MGGGFGGAIRVTGGALQVQRTSAQSLFDGNHADIGGAISFAGTTLNIDQTTFSNNSATLSGGALEMTQGAVTIQNTTIGPNNNAKLGGGFYLQTVAKLTQVTISKNTASVRGGAGWVGSGGKIQKGTNVTIDGDIAGPGAGLGGGAPSQGGGIYVEDGGTVELINTIVADCSADQGPDIFGTITSDGHNLISDSSGGSGYVGSDILNVNALLDNLGPNGGPTLTQMPFRNSPAVDAGDDLAAPGPWDQRGVGYPRIAGDHIDIGAVELQPTDPQYNINGVGGASRAATIQTADSTSGGTTKNKEHFAPRLGAASMATTAEQILINLSSECR